MRLHNTLTRKIDAVAATDGKTVRIYSCGPTVYDHVHIGNLSAYIFADTLRRVIAADGNQVRHVMNYTDVDDKTIRRSGELYPDKDPRERLSLLTQRYIDLFMDDMSRIGNDVGDVTFVRATDANTMQGMKDLISELHEKGFAYTADDGIYFSIDAYRKSGKKYGQLLEITSQNTSDARIQNDEYDKESIHDFALWKKQKPGEPSWEFTLDGQDMTGRPGWHIECSVMSRQNLGQPFDIHTGGVDLIFPHHENEIAQSTANESNPLMASIFAHNDHILVDGKKMSKSAQNFYTLQDVVDRGFDPLAFRLLILQAHYRSQVNFTWESLEAAQNRLRAFRAMADTVWQCWHTSSSASEPKKITATATTASTQIIDAKDLAGYTESILQALDSDVNTPQALVTLSSLATVVESQGISVESREAFRSTLVWLDSVLGLNLSERPDITDQQRKLITERETARSAYNWELSDTLRDKLLEDGLAIRDTPRGTAWYRIRD